ncbi:hypothetical protein [Winogradskyella forsetii]|uniref:hypothetical protein n=1 Tax=Winogradskyella forsetii TaxID=2686077 RepID=UPI0015BDEA01|nr:hypothetical protein [Winogradskyella forsetii]
MKKLSLLFILFIFFGCSYDDSNSNDNQQEVFGTKEITVVLELPENSNINSDDLTISTIFTEDGQVNNGTGNVEIFDNNAIELVYATNSSGNLILMSYFNPADGNAIELNSKTTAQSLAMLHPWTMNLSVQARQEAFQEIALMPEFTNYHNQVIQGINSGEINPLASSTILQAIDSFQNTLLNRVEIETLPLLMVAENSTVNLTNKKSSMAYNLQLFDENNQPIGEDYIVDGINKEILSWSNVLNILGGNFDLFQPTDVQFPIPNVNQQYNLKADRWSGKAFWQNGANLASSIVGIVSTTLGTILKGADCALPVGTFFANGAIDIVQTLSSGQMTASQAANQLNTFLLSRTSELKEITAECSQYALTELGGFGKILGALSLIGNFENGVLLFFNVVDIAQYDSEIQFCFERNENEIVECGEIDLSGNWSLIPQNNACISNIGIKFNSDGTIQLAALDMPSIYSTYNYTLIDGELNINILSNFDAANITANYDSNTSDFIGTIDYTSSPCSDSSNLIISRN